MIGSRLRWRELRVRAVADLREALGSSGQHVPSTQYAWALAAPVATLGASVLTNALASRALGPAGFGQFAVGVVSLTLLGTAMSLGLPATMVRFWGRLASDSAATGERYRLLAWGLVVIGGALVGSAFLVAQVVASGSLARWVPPGTALILVLAGLGVALTQMAAAEGQMRLNFRSYFVTNAGNAALRLAGLVTALLAVRALSVRAALLGFGAGSFAAGAALAYGALGRTTQSIRAVVRGAGSSARALVAFSLPILGSSFVVAAIESVDILVVAASLPPDRVGLYSAAVRLLVVQSTVLAAMTAAALPLAAKADAAGARWRFARHAVALGMPLGLLITAILGAFSPVLVRLVYGPAYADSAVVFLVLSVGLLPNFVGNPASQMVYVAGAPGFLLLVHCAQLIALLAGLPAVTPRWDIMGVAVYRSVVNLAAVAVILIRVKGFSREPRELLAGVGDGQ